VIRWHQDLSPANILVFANPTPNKPRQVELKIADFGLGHIMEVREGEEVKAPNNRGAYSYGQSKPG
jgi:serine/threonine protein kinase